MTQCLMLDVDGVVITGRPQDGGSWAATLAQDLGIRQAALQEHFFALHWNDIVLGRADLHDVLEQYLPRFAPDVGADRLISYWFEMDSRIDADVLADVAALREGGLRVFLATNQEHHRAAYLMDDLGLSKHVDGMIYSAQIGARKPDPAFYAACQDRTGFGVDQLLLVDDMAQNIEAAHRAGWRGQHWTGAEPLSRLFDRAQEP